MFMLLTISLILFFIITGRNVLFWVHLWQLKEYRLDRLIVHLKDTKQGRGILFSPTFFLLCFMFLLYFTGVFVDFFNQYFPFLTVLLFSILTLITGRDVLTRKVKRPVFTTKAVLISLISYACIVVFSLLSLTDPYLWLILATVFTPFIIAFIVFMFAFPTEVYVDYYMEKAKKKRKLLKKLQVIAISGSYGKSSTKEVIADVLSIKYSVVKTSLSNNTPLAIAKTLLNRVNSQTDFFVVELGAYKRGEIKELAEMVQPTIGVTTAVSDQHLALYGNMQDVVESELELIKTLPKKSIVLLNGNSNGIRLLFERVKNKQIVWYTTSGKFSKQKNIIASKIHALANGVEWAAKYGKEHIDFHSPLLGVHTVENILPAVFLGLKFGLSQTEIKHAVADLKPLPKTMEQVVFRKHVTVVDDSFNASPESVIAAVDYLKLFESRKIIVMSPLIELGKKAKERHKEIGRALASLNTVFLTNTNFLKEIKQGIEEKKGKTEIITGSYSYIAQMVNHMLKKGDAIVFEGKEAGIVLRHMQ